MQGAVQQVQEARGRGRHGDLQLSPVQGKPPLQAEAAHGHRQKSLRGQWQGQEPGRPADEGPSGVG